MRYKIVSEQSIEKLQASVGELLKVGWQPQGGITFHDYDFLQVVTHPENDPTPLELEWLLNEIGDRLERTYPILAIPEEDLTEDQKVERQEFVVALAESFAAIARSKSEKDSD